MTRNQVGLPIGGKLPGSTDNGGRGVPVTGKPVKIYGVERSMVDSRWCVYGPRGEALSLVLGSGHVGLGEAAMSNDKSQATASPLSWWWEVWRQYKLLGCRKS